MASGWLSVAVAVGKMRVGLGSVETHGGRADRKALFDCDNELCPMAATRGRLREFLSGYGLVYLVRSAAVTLLL